MLKEVLVVEGKWIRWQLVRRWRRILSKPAALPWHPILCARLRLRIKNAGVINPRLILTVPVSAFAAF